jgi:thioesterase domain-containing protein
MIEVHHRDPAHGPAWLKHMLEREIPLARHLAVEVETADDAMVRLCAPLAPNRNHRGTAFGGSLFSLAVLTGWAWTTRYLAIHHFAADALIQESSIRYLAPARGPLEAVLESPATTLVDKFRRMLERAGRGRIRLGVEVHVARTAVARFEGLFVATLR